MSKNVRTYALGAPSITIEIRRINVLETGDTQHVL